MGTTFDVIKLRSMYQDAEAQTGAIWAQKNDPRVTPVGRWMLDAQNSDR
ncbi:sugar transferase [Streptomyces brasiliscabiei]